jgi:hypothetical protein
LEPKRAGPGWVGILIVLAVLALLVCVQGCNRADAAPVVSGEVRLGAATPTAFDYGSEQTAFGVEGIVKASEAGRPLSVSVSCRHFFASDPFSLSKSRLKANADLDIGRNTSLFAEYEWAYRAHSEWGWTGVRFRF